jgi:thiamine monophosphate synthase
VAIGGIDETNVEEVVRAGAGCVAVVRAVFGKEDVESACRSLKSKLS